MRDASSVITAAADGLVKEIASEYELSERRIYEILSTDNPYPKTKRLIRVIAHCDKSDDKWRVKLIKADLAALFSELLGENIQQEIDSARLHSELNDAIYAKLKGLSRADRLKECREAVSILADEIAFLEKDQG